MNEATCDTCKHWGPNHGALGLQRRLIGKCERVTVGGILWLADRTAPCAIIDDTLDDSGCLVTNPMFGCILHEPKK